ncbi:MAG: acetyltransferase [Planctomycetota bacterium]
MIQPAHSTPPLVVYGAGDHGRVVADAARAMGMRVLGFLDDQEADAPEGGAWHERLAPDDPRLAGAQFIVAVGDNAARLRVFDQLVEQGKSLTHVVHPSAAVSRDAVLGRGVYVGPMAVVGPEATVGDAGLINSAAVVEHHSQLAAGVHVAPSATLAGRVTLGRGVLVGLGAKVLPGRTLGAGCVVGAGAVVTHDFGEGQTLTGVPARPR